jgi:hypothetical protein
MRNVHEEGCLSPFAPPQTPLGDLGSSPSEHAQVNAITHYLTQFGPRWSWPETGGLFAGSVDLDRLPHPIEATLTWAHSGRNE